MGPNVWLLGLRLLFSLHLYSWLMITGVMWSGVLQNQGSVIFSYQCNWSNNVDQNDWVSALSCDIKMFWTWQVISWTLQVSPECWGPRVHCQFLSIVLCILEALGDSGCAWIKSTMCICILEIPLWSCWLKWCPTASFRFLLVIL